MNDHVKGGLTTSVVGSHAHPSWFVAGIAAAERGELGPTDIAEMFDDAVDTAIRDQEQAGIDVISDGEMRRAGFFTAEFYRHLTSNFRTEDERPSHRYFADDAMVLDQMMTGTVTGSMLGLPGNGRQVTFRILHVFEFADGLISRENVWLDSAAIQQQLA